MVETAIRWYRWEGEHTIRVLHSNGQMRGICRCGFKTHWYQTEDKLNDAVVRHSHNVAMQKVS